MEKDDEIKGEGNSYTTHFRKYDPRIGRWLSIEPKPVAWESPYVFSRNNPILYNDPKGDCPDGNCLEVNLVQADNIARNARAAYGDNIIGMWHNKDVVNNVYNHIANAVANKYEIDVADIQSNIEAHTFLTLTVQMAVDQTYSKVTDSKAYEKYEIAIGETSSIGGKADLIVDRWISNYQKQESWDTTLLILETAAEAEGLAALAPLATGLTRVSLPALYNVTKNRITNAIASLARIRLSSIVAKTETMLSGAISTVRSIDKNAIIGFRGSLATGTKFKSGKPFNPSDFDVDAFIVSDDLAAKFGKKVRFRDGRKVGLGQISDDLEREFQSAFPGYRVEPGKPFTFRVFTKAEFDKIVKPNGFKIIK